MGSRVLAWLQGLEAKDEVRERNRMAGGREYSKGQQKIIKRHYDSMEPRAIQRLQEVVSELFVAESEAARKRLWKSVQTAFKNLKIDDTRARTILEEQDLGALAELVGTLR